MAKYTDMAYKPNDTWDAVSNFYINEKEAKFFKSLKWKAVLGQVIAGIRVFNKKIEVRVGEKIYNI